VVPSSRGAPLQLDQLAEVLGDHGHARDGEIAHVLGVAPEGAAQVQVERLDVRLLRLLI
jgi:hypothetical protein